MGLWDNDGENEEFRDVPEETTKDYVPQPQMEAPRRPAAPAPQPNQISFNGATGRFDDVSISPMSVSDQDIENLVESIETEDDFAAILNDANLRIEQGKLYQMIMNHELFEGMDAEPRAVQNVQKEIRKFARERMEIMLGMRQEQAPQAAMISSPFNDLEVDILKKLASKATNGATESPEANQVAQAVREAPRRQTLNPLGGSTGLKKAPSVTRPAAQAPRQQNLPSKPAAPIKRTKNDQIIEQILAEEGVSRADLELEYTGIGKSVSQLSEQELLDRQKQTAARIAKRRTVKSTAAIPMASPEQEAMLAMTRAQQTQGAPGSLSALILEKVKSMPIKNP